VKPVSNAAFAIPVTASDGIHDSDVTVALMVEAGNVIAPSDLRRATLVQEMTVRGTGHR
jgi:hypothetical protein